MNALRIFISLSLALAASQASAAGFATSDRGPLRTAYSRAEVRVDGDVATTVVTHVFTNDLDEPVEVTYAFPLPDDASVVGFADWRQGRRVEARAEGREAAEREYEDAAAEERSAALVETTADAGFQMRLSTVAPHGSRRVELRYVQTLSVLGGERTYVFPADARGEVPRPSVMDIDVNVTSASPIQSMRSLNQRDVRLASLDASHAAAHLSRAGGLGLDLVLRWRTQVQALDLAARAARPDPEQPGYIETRFAFNEDAFDRFRPARDVVLVVDRSLSMAGEPMARARAMAEGVLAELGPDDRFELIAFNEFVIQSFGGLVPADDDAVLEAFSDLGALEASGRSNLAAALDAAADAVRADAGAMVLLITDGQPTTGAGYGLLGLPADTAFWGEHRVMVAHMNYPSRDASLMGLFPNVALRYLPDGPAGDEVMEEIIGQIVAPGIEALHMDVVGPDVSAVEGRVPSRLTLGDGVRLVARAESDALVVVSGLLHGLPVLLQQPVRMPASDEGHQGRALSIEWARLRIARLEAALDAGAKGLDARAAEAEVRSLGEGFGLATRFTSYVLTDALSPDRIKPGDPEIRIRAPRSASGVRAILPWGEIVECQWQDDEALWLGRFLVPRGTADGMYRMRVFVDGQDTTELRGTLLFRVDSEAPEMELLRADDAPVVAGAPFKVWARPLDHVFEGGLLAAVGDVVVRDRIDLKRIVLRIGEREIPMVRVGFGELWEATVPGDLAPGDYNLRLLAVDYALNSSEATLDVAVQP
ncbi:MAG: VWA domain-containing protein [Deltaproteobacteria bacterium]|nr:VWA domain-containing protein [Deltaproteobacteria bacterium]